MRKMTKKKKRAFMGWIDNQLEADPKFRQKVEEALNAMRLEQDLIALRKRRGLSQRQAARLMGVSQPAVAKIESPRVKNAQVKTLVQYALALGATLKVEVSPSRRTASRSRKLVAQAV